MLFFTRLHTLIQYKCQVHLGTGHSLQEVRGGGCTKCEGWVQVMVGTSDGGKSVSHAEEGGGGHNRFLR